MSVLVRLSSQTPVRADGLWRGGHAPFRSNNLNLRGGHVPEIATIAGIGENFWRRGLQQVFQQAGLPLEEAGSPQSSLHTRAVLRQ